MTTTITMPMFYPFVTIQIFRSLSVGWGRERMSRRVFQKKQQSLFSITNNADELLRTAWERGDTCPITLDLIHPESACVVSECRHVFRAQAIEEWANTNKSCPLCRTHIHGLIWLRPTPLYRCVPTIDLIRAISVYLVYLLDRQNRIQNDNIHHARLSIKHT